MEKEKIKLILFHIALFLLIFIFTNIILTSTLFIFKIKVSLINFFVSLLSTFITSFLFFKKDVKVTLPKNYLIIVFSSLIIVFLSIFIEGKIYDYTYDGNAYHKSAIGAIKDGWNPVYSNVNETNSFIKNSNNSLWINSYPKGVYFFGANIYKVTKNIETAKCINIISVVIIFCIICSILIDKNYSKFFIILFSLCTISFSVVTTQLFTNYVDILVYIFFALLTCCFILFESRDSFIRLNTKLFIYFMILCIIINIKFSSFAFAGIYCLVFFVYKLIKGRKDKTSIKFLKKNFITSFMAIIFGVFIIGLSTYPLNLLKFNHPLYPLMGSNKIDIMTNNSPKVFKNKIPIEKFLISNFSKVDNIYYSIDRNPTLKIPFTIHKDELRYLKNVDTRISGGGIIFGGILILSVIFMIISTPKLYKKNKRLFYLTYIYILTTVSFILFLDDIWWIRYFPQEYIFVLLSFLVFDYSNNSKIAKKLCILVMILLIMNNLASLFVTTYYVSQKNIEITLNSKKISKSCQMCPKKICTNTGNFTGTIYNLKDENKELLIEEENTKLTNPNGKYFGFIDWKCCI